MIHHETNALEAIRVLTLEVESGPLPVEERERILFHLSRHCRIAALSALLARADVVSFRERLRMSGTWRLNLLSDRATQERPFNRFTGAAQIAPLCDALAAGADTVAQDIARMSASGWLTRKEFEDDFYYGRLLGGFALREPGWETAADGLLSGLVRVIGDEGAPRVRVCRALLTHESGAFLDALLELLEQHGAWFRARAGTLQSREPAFGLERSVCVEGLALLHLALLHGLSIDPEAEYPLMPDIVRVG
ncbi:hypothetical protein G4177_21690 [Corallococcus sp. ZKHCc1 1396]|uniref:Uncharacterized protein n=1 Tax=Corallococcus soli TaxID=2710757 RepID=A0ABR9PS76_9BACT|nr:MULTISPECIES: immunity 49 family protein [Corallococcus]MBE4750788.1 hypothetical protein [Corallococcus soli]MCY1031895.1 immunity 49 family protein [Corallococcus sp. BB11-1]RYZ18012.1 MAG: hypothetical protein EOO70_00195 [Myxococcaceae bacterium]